MACVALQGRDTFQPMDWDDVRHFLALARLGSVRSAGTSLGVSHTTILRRVEALESQLAVRLFDRHRDGYLLTDAGRQMLRTAERIEHEMSVLERDLSGQDERLAGTVAITCCDSFVSRVLICELRVLCMKHPGIELCVSTDSRPFDLSKREADLAVRTLAKGAEPPAHLVGRRLAPVTVASYVSRAYERQLDPELGAKGSRWVAPEDREYFQNIIGRSCHPDLPLWGGFSSLTLLVQAACEGLGLVMLPTYVGDREPALRRLAKSTVFHAADLWLLSHPDLRGNSRLRAARMAIADAFEHTDRLFRGEEPADHHLADAPSAGDVPTRTHEQRRVE